MSLLIYTTSTMAWCIFCFFFFFFILATENIKLQFQVEIFFLQIMEIISQWQIQQNAILNVKLFLVWSPFRGGNTQKKNENLFLLFVFIINWAVACVFFFSFFLVGLNIYTQTMLHFDVRVLKKKKYNFTTLDIEALFPVPVTLNDKKNGAHIEILNKMLGRALKTKQFQMALNVRSILCQRELLVKIQIVSQLWHNKGKKKKSIKSCRHVGLV